MLERSEFTSLIINWLSAERTEGCCQNALGQICGQFSRVLGDTIAESSVAK